MFMKKILYFFVLFLWTKPIWSQSCRVSDSLQLIALYQGIRPNWDLAQPVRNWSGITLNGVGAVISINLGGRRLSGTLPLLNLPDLEDLLLHDNQLTGNIPNFNLPKLRRLFLYLNQLSGTIPNFNLPELDHLHLHANRLTGEIPLFERLTKLRKLELPHNLLTGKVPPFNFPIIQHLDIGANHLSGTVPVLNCPMMEHLYLSINELSGPVPVFNCPMQRLLLETCRWTFGDMQPVYNAFRNRIVEYAPQDSIFKDTTIRAPAAVPFAVSLGIDNAMTSNQYQWFKNNAPFGNPTQTNQLIINNLQLSDEGIYTCKVTNPNMPALTLYSRKINLIVQTGNCSDSVRLLAARQRAINWGWNPNWQLQSPYLSWAGVHYAGGCADSIYIRRDSMLCGALGASFQFSVPNTNMLTNATYRWYRNDVWIGTTPNATFSIFNLTKNDFAKYNVVVEQAGYLPIRLDLGTLQVCCAETKIVPNPTTDIVKIYCGGKLGETVTIYNEIGQLMATQMVTQEPMPFDLSAFQSGVYIVRWGDKAHKILKIN